MLQRFCDTSVVKFLVGFPLLFLIINFRVIDCCSEKNTLYILTFPKHLVTEREYVICTCTCSMKCKNCWKFKADTEYGAVFALILIHELLGSKDQSRFFFVYRKNLWQIFSFKKKKAKRSSKLHKLVASLAPLVLGLKTIITFTP